MNTESKQLPATKNEASDTTAITLLINQDPLEALRKLKLLDASNEDLQASKFEALKPHEAQFIVRDFRMKVSQLIHLTLLENDEEDDAEDTELLESLKDDLTALKDSLLSSLKNYIERHGEHLSRESKRLHKFQNEANYDSEKQYFKYSLANFNAVWNELVELLQKKRRLSALLKKKLDKAKGSNLPGLQTLSFSLLSGDTTINNKIEKLQSDLERVWSSSEVRMAYMRERHMEYIKQIGEGRAILDTPNVVNTLNRIHQDLFGTKAYKVSGPALVGPPGWGKTSLLQDYFRSFGLEALSADIDPGQSSFSLMARPTLGLENKLGDTKGLLEFFSGFGDDEIYNILKSDSKKIVEIFDLDQEEVEEALKAYEGPPCNTDKLMKINEQIEKFLKDKMQFDFIDLSESMIQSKGYAYCLLLNGLKQNQPVILNEFPALDEWTFIHGLLTAVPCSDSEAAPRPTLKPKEGQTIKNPKGWFFNTITGDWMRVPEYFRVCFTGNIGIEYGNTGVPPALMSRIGSSLINIEGLPPEEIAQCIAWPYLSSEETGEFLLGDEMAYKIHFLVADFFPKLQEKLKEVTDENFSISIRVIIDLCKLIHPQINENPCDLNEAIMRTIVRPCHALRFNESLKIIIAMLIGTGFLTSHDEEFKTMDKDLSMDRTQGMIQELKNPFEQKKYDEDKENFEGRCPVCSVKHCPIHGSRTKEFVEFAEKAAEISKVGLDVELVEAINDFLVKLLENGEVEKFVELYMGKLDSDSLIKEALVEKGEVIGDVLSKVLLDSVSDSIAAFNSLELVLVAVEKLLLSKNKLDEEAIKSISQKNNDAFLDYLAESKSKSKTSKSTTVKARAARAKSLSDRVKKYLKLKYVLKELGIVNENEEINKYIKKYIKKIKDIELLNLIQKLYSDDEETKQAFAKYLEKNADKLKEQLEAKKEEVLLGKRREIKTSKGPPKHPPKLKPLTTGILQTPEIESLSTLYLQYLDMAEALIELGIINLNEIQDVLGLIEHKLERMRISGQSPQSLTPYIRVVQRLSRLKKLNIDNIISGITNPQVVELPPMKNY